MNPTRRDFVKLAAASAATLPLIGLGRTAEAHCGHCGTGKSKQLWRVSLCEYSLHRMIPNEVDPLDFGPFTKKTFGIEGVDYWNGEFKDKATDTKYLAEMKKRSDGAGIIGGVILIDGEGNLGDPDTAKRKQAVENHHKWIDAAKQLGCYAIRVNARSSGSYEEQLKLAADGLSMLTDYGAKNEISVIVENHGGLSSNGKWLAEVMKTVNKPHCGTLPDFGNFGKYDRYLGVKETMPFAKNVSAKSHDFDDEGNETRTDYYKMMKIVADSGFRGWVGIEFEGRKSSPVEGVKKTLALLNKVHAKLLAEMG